MGLDYSCKIDGCVYKMTPDNAGLCGAHAALQWRYGTTTPTKVCHWCKQEFIFQVGRGGSPRFAYCDECRQLENQYGRIIPKGIFNNYRITPIEFAKMLESQGHSCKICQVDLGYVNGGRLGKRTNLVVDHDHNCCPLIPNGYTNSRGWKRPYSCGKCVRGLICYTCNLLVGHYDSYKKLATEIERYIEDANVRNR